MDTASPDAIDPSVRELFDAARSVSGHAYAPYSRLRVGAAVRTERGGVFLGCNVENASYGLTCCAERNAVFAAVAAEGAEMRLECIAVHADGHTGSPCGACRQVLAEFGPDARVLFTSDDSIVAGTVAELLPGVFSLNPAPPVF